MRNDARLAQANCTALSFQELTAAALVLPGLLPTITLAADGDSIDFQYSHYQEGKRDLDLSQNATNPTTGVTSNIRVPNRRNPIEVDSLHGSARVSLTDRVKFAFNYVEDTWSGATPFGSAPAHSGANTFKSFKLTPDGTTVGGASPYANAQHLYLDKQGNPVAAVTDPITGQTTYPKDPAVHVMGYASPETRKQGDFKLSYDWDEAAVSLGGGISTERDYESRFVNLGGRMDFNQKQTTVNLGLSYTNSTIDAAMDHIGYRFFGATGYGDQYSFNKATGITVLHGNRQDWATQLGLTQVVNQDAVAELGMGYTRSTGFMENPYKIIWLFAPLPIDQQPQGLPPGIVRTQGTSEIEHRPDERNQWHWNARWAQYIAPLDAALHLDYQFAHDDWDINAHTFAADWVQPLGAGWTITPRVRYYSQDAAFFYAPFFKTTRDKDGFFVLPKSFSSDHRLSGYGTLSGGVTVAKEFAKGIHLETGFEYYTHQGSLKLGGGGESNFADFDYWVANAALKVDLASVGQGSSGGSSSHHHQADHPTIPAGVLFGHTLPKAGNVMVGYRYMHNQQGGGFLNGDQSVSEQQILDNGCPGQFGSDEDGSHINFNGTNCSMLPREMTMSMHMLDLMVAPTDWLTLMLMPQFVDMAMTNYTPDSLKNDDGGGHGHGGATDHLHETGGIGDTGLYALVKLFDQPNHHLHASLGFSAPTGDVGIKLKERTNDLDGAYIHYGMQLGSGTWDFKPSLTYTGKAEDWSWGAQLAGTKRLEGSNKSGYALGDIFETSVWGGYDLTHWLSATVRVTYSWQGSIKGRYLHSTRDDWRVEFNCKNQFTLVNDPDGDGIPNGLDTLDQAGYDLCVTNAQRIQDARDSPTPMDAPSNYGGHYVDVGFGLSATVPSGSLAGNRLAFEWLQPVFTDINGYQLDRDGALSFTWSYGF